MSFDLSNLNLTSIVTSGIANMANAAHDIIDEYIESPEERQQAKERVLQLQNKQQAMRTEETIAVVNARARVFVEELKQDDKYTKRARPTLVYAGLLLIFYCYALAPSFFTTASLSLPSEFWMAWGGVCSVWCIGRSAERISPQSTAAKLLNSAEPYRNAAARMLGHGRK